MNIIEQERINKFVQIAKAVYKEKKKEAVDFCQVSLGLLDTYPHMFLLGAIMDRRTNAAKAWKTPYNIAQKLGGMEFKLFASKSVEFYKESIPSHVKDAGVFFYKAIQKIQNNYAGDAAKIWNNEPSCEELIYRLRQFDGVGPKISTMVANIFSRNTGKITFKLKGLSAVDISADIHVERVFYRMGFIQKENSIEQTIEAARLINPNFPGLSDILCWQIGNSEICTKDPHACKCAKCKLNEICKKIGVKK